MSEEMIIYVITNKTNGKQYVGQTKDLNKRMLFHLLETRRDYSYNELYKDMKEQGEENFSIEAIENVNALEADDREIHWIKEYNTLYPNGYNLTTGGKSGGEYSELSKKRIGEKTKERWSDPEVAEKMLQGARLGGKVSGDLSRGEERVPREIRECEHCGDEFKVIETSSQRYCTNQCANVANFKLATEVYIEERKSIHEQIREFSEEWAKENRKIVTECPFNRITSTLKPLFDEIENLYDVKDMRVISKAICGKDSRKEMLKHLKDIVND